jgi:hypothetical protein
MAGSNAVVDMRNPSAFLTVAATATLLVMASVPTRAQNYFTLYGAPYAGALDPAVRGVPPGSYWLGAGGNLVPPGGYWAGGGGNIVPSEPGYNIRTLNDGNLMSDGNCSFVEGVPVGNCN